MPESRNKPLSSSAAALVQIAAYRIDLSNEKVDLVLERLEAEEIREEWQLRFVQSDEWRALGAPIGLSSAVRACLHDKASPSSSTISVGSTRRTSGTCSTCASTIFSSDEFSSLASPRETPIPTKRKSLGARVSPHRDSGRRDDVPICPTKNDSWSNMKLAKGNSPKLGSQKGPNLKKMNFYTETGLDRFLLNDPSLFVDGENNGLVAVQDGSSNVAGDDRPVPVPTVTPPTYEVSDNKKATHIDLSRVANVLLDGNRSTPPLSLTSIVEGPKSKTDAPQLPKRLESLAQMN